MLVISDSDVRAGRDHLSQVVAALEPSRVGLVTRLYRGRSVGGLFWSNLAAMDVNYRLHPQRGDRDDVGHRQSLPRP